MITQLDAVEARILGALVEKSLTTPENYPLSMNAVINACNQKTSRDPVMSLDEAAVGQGLHSLLTKALAARIHEPGSRVPKFSHRVDILLSSGDPKVVGTMCILLLRGPQTAGEINSRADRLCQFQGTAEVESLLQDLANRPEGAIVTRLPKQPGQKEARYQHLFCGTPAPSAAPAPAANPAASAVPNAPKPPAPGPPDRMGELERRIAPLENEVKLLSGRLLP